MDYAHTQDVKQLNGRMSAAERKGRDVCDRSPTALLFYDLSYLDPLKGLKACSPKCQALHRSKPALCSRAANRSRAGTGVDMGTAASVTLLSQHFWDRDEPGKQLNVETMEE